MLLSLMLACAPDWNRNEDVNSEWVPREGSPALSEDDALPAPDTAARTALVGTQHVWVAMDGLAVTSGPTSDAENDASFIIGTHFSSSEVVFPAWTRTPAQEEAMLTSLGDRFAGYDIAFHRQRPTGVYTTLVISDFAAGPSAGVAPLDCGNRHAADIAFVYKAQTASQHWVQTAAAHELGHAFGLAHVVDTSDPMYWTAGADYFGVSAIDHAHATADCVGGGTQDGPALLAENLGVAAGLPGPAPWWEGTFADDDGNVHEAGIEAIAAYGVTQGCGDDAGVPLYCPSDLVTRGQMVVFLQRALGLQSNGYDFFTDDDGTFYEDAANAAAAHGITFGCSNGEFCGDEPVTRGEMASFLSRAFDYPPSTTDHFVDDDGSGYEADINRIADAGVTLGCGAGLYCPEDPVLRDQMASFLSRALGL